MIQDWKTTTLGEAFVTVTGNTPPKNNPNFYGEFIPFVKPPELCDSALDSAEDGLSEAGAAVARTAPPESILVSCIGNLGKIGLNKVPIAFNQQINAILPDHEKALPAFLFYQLLSCAFKAQLDALASGTTLAIVNKSKFNSVKIVLPPIPEQRRIVAILDEAFEGIATAKANAEKNLQNARAIFESYRDSMFTKREAEWVERRLDSVAEFSQGIQIGLEQHSKTPADGLVRFIRIIDYTQGTDDVRYVRDPGPRYWVTDTDLVMVRYGTPGLIGRGIEGVIANNLFKIAVRDGSVTNDFLAAFLLQSEIQGYLRSQGASTMPALTFKQLGSVRVAYPKCKDRQDTMVAGLDALSEETERLEAIYHQKLAALDELKKSLLHQAFSGAL